jgi:hypothetical protein
VSLPIVVFKMWLSLLASASVVSASAQTSLASRNKTCAPRPLKFQRDGTFQISIMEDLHFGESKK